MSLRRLLVLLLLTAVLSASGCVRHRAHRRAYRVECCEPVCPCPHMP